MARTTSLVPRGSAASTGTSSEEAHRSIYQVVKRIPKGYVATYGQVAELAGLPRRARMVGRALSLLPISTRVPWHRVINAQGRISLRSHGLEPEKRQAALLGGEGVRVVRGAVSLARYRWPVSG